MESLGKELFNKLRKIFRETYSAKGVVKTLTTPVKGITLN